MKPRASDYDQFNDYEKAIEQWELENGIDRASYCSDGTLSLDESMDSTTIADVCNELLDALDGCLKILAVKGLTEAEKMDVCGYIDLHQSLKMDD